ncbi:hypothetical protein ACQP1P_04930 [Dactylosporangium sp. CA-052675]|uniref:hypothetical protein n=1 Tax=Dactylosporangium sp. CA-052675 TaxID=3239927 RepID=UPI003D9376A9
MSEQGNQPTRPGEPVDGISPHSPWAVPPTAMADVQPVWDQDQPTEPIGAPQPPAVSAPPGPLPPAQQSSAWPPPPPGPLSPSGQPLPPPGAQGPPHQPPYQQMPPGPYGVPAQPQPPTQPLPSGPPPSYGPPSWYGQAPPQPSYAGPPPGVWTESPPAPVPPLPSSIAPHPVSGAPQPVSGSPQSGGPYGLSQPVSSVPQSVSGAPQSVGPLGLPQPWTPDPSVPPLPKPGESEPTGWFEAGSGGRTVLWTVVTAVVVAMLAGAGGYLIGTGGRLTRDAGGAGPQAGASVAPSVSSAPSLHPFEATQAEKNRAKFDGSALDLATPWLTEMGGCQTSAEAGGPKLYSGEAKRVSCRYGGVLLQFVSYKTMTDHDVAQANATKENATSADIAPGVAAVTQKNGGSGTAGQYIEFARKGADAKAVCGIAWSRTGADSALYMETLCDDVLGGNWDVLRDLWQRHS